MLNLAFHAIRIVLISFLTLKNLQRYYFDIKIKMEEEKLRLYLENPISPLFNCLSFFKG